MTAASGHEPGTIPLTSRAEVATASPERYAKQLGAHLGHKLQVTQDGPRTLIQFERGRCEMTSGEGALLLAATAQDEPSLAVVEDVVGRHLEKFGARGDLVVSWQRG